MITELPPAELRRIGFLVVLAVACLLGA